MSTSMAIRMQYVGACALLARLSGKIKDADDHACIKRALEDCATTLGGFEVVATSDGGFSLEPTTIVGSVA